ncbi:hypothetical protein LV716_06725 [Flagellimonas sp. HMM57]|uniref:hypothetical protein n=1 Tax=unclassified Flagellimonas TaxID=2644544 RepID=UPI0013D3019E|nr:MULTISPECIES: hypothetical protein [unclassified Flagellimonas]UII77458.1 hypothetical protein LV716_06725 [Flagellimonas sp. HMM57]
MKTIKLMNMALLCTALTLCACSNGENGTDGLPGADGVSCWDLNGNGTGDAEEDVNDDGNFDALDCKGEQGEQGDDGNANVFRMDVDVSGFSGSELVYDLTTSFIALEEIPKYAWFIYLEDNNLIYSVPGPIESNSKYTRYYINEETGLLIIRFHNTIDDSIYNVPEGKYDELRIIAIEALVQSPGKGASQSIVDELKAAGVDTNDYHAMVDHFGL